MCIKITCFMVFLLLLVLASGLFAQSDSDRCPITVEGDSVSVSLPESPDLPSINGYTVPRKQVLMEEITALWWSSCPAAAVAADRLKKEKGDTLALIAYHASDAFSIADGNTRINYYNPQYVPTAIFNGIKWVVGATNAYNIYRDSVNQQMTVNTPGILSLKLKYNPTNRTGKIFAEFKSVDQITDINLRLRYAITESHMHYHWGGLDSLHDILRDMVPSPTGVSFFINAGETFVDSQSFSINSAWVDTKCELVVFVQSDVATYLKKVLISNSVPIYHTHVAGDANSDGATTISDVVFLTNYLFYGGLQPNPPEAGDPNDDCDIDLADVVYLVQYLFYGGPAPHTGAICAD